jgi:hypothetical protein
MFRNFLFDPAIHAHSATVSCLHLIPTCTDPGTTYQLCPACIQAHSCVTLSHFAPYLGYMLPARLGNDFHKVVLHICVDSDKVTYEQAWQLRQHLGLNSMCIKTE